MSSDLLQAAQQYADALDEDIGAGDLREPWYRNTQKRSEKKVLAVLAAWWLWLEAEIPEDWFLWTLPAAFWAQAEARLREELEKAFLDAAVMAGRSQANGLIEPFSYYMMDRIRLWAQEEATTQARLLVAETRRAVDEASGLAFAAGMAPPAVDALLRAARTFALNRRFARAVIEQALQKPDAMTLAQVYGPKLEESRKKMIARSFSSEAVASGSRVVGDAVHRSGVNLVKVWITVPDERRCHGCATQHGSEVPYDSLFYTPYGPVFGPPLHPNCRCQAMIQKSGEGG